MSDVDAPRKPPKNPATAAAPGIVCRGGGAFTDRASSAAATIVTTPAATLMSVGSTAFRIATPSQIPGTAPPMSSATRRGQADRRKRTATEIRVTSASDRFAVTTNRRS